jgi:hypothetical protein
MRNFARDRDHNAVGMHSTELADGQNHRTCVRRALQIDARNAWLPAALDPDFHLKKPTVIFTKAKTSGFH